MDPTLLFALSVIFFVLACVFGAAAVLILIARRRVPKLSGSFAVAFLVLFVASAAAAPPGYDPGEVERVERIRAGFAPKLEQYRQGHGEYPPTLPAADVAVPNTRYGRLEYQAGVDEQGEPFYTISMGDYFQNGFVTWWDTRRTPGDWYLDM